MFPAKLCYLQHNIKKDNWQWQATENFNKIANGAPCDDAVHTLYHNLSYFKCCTVAQYTHTCNLICARKKSTVFTYADFHGGGMHHSIMFISLTQNFSQARQQMCTAPTQTHLHPSIKHGCHRSHKCSTASHRQTSALHTVPISPEIWKVYTEIHLCP